MNHSALLTDLYQLTMMAGYYENNMDEIASFEVFIRNYPPNRCYFIAAGLEQIIDYALNIKFTKDEIEYIRNLKGFENISADFYSYLENFKFTGDIWAMKEGNVFFTNEPVIRITAPVIQAQLLETYILSMFNMQTMIASKASRAVCAAEGRQVIEFGSRRAHGPESAVLAARASYISGCVGTSNVYAGYKFGIPVYGTIAHSWVLAFDKEEEAFENYFKIFPNNSILLVDTYDTIEGVKKAIQTSPDIKGIRIDSGDLYSLSVEARKILDEAGLKNAIIVASGDLNEIKIKKLVEAGAPIDSFGLGTSLSTSADAPYLSGVYKLVEVEKNHNIIGKAKFSEKKATYPCKKQVWRFIDDNGKFVKDIISTIEENYDNAVPLLHQVVKDGKQITANPTLDKIRESHKQSLSCLDGRLLSIDCVSGAKIEISDKLQEEFNKTKTWSVS